MRSTAPGELDVSRETMDRLANFADLVQKWNGSINLVSRNSVLDLWPRHIQDSLQISELVPAGMNDWCDLGSGGGFPGLVVAILAKENLPKRHVVLIESDQRKSAFLRTVIRELDLNAKVNTQRIEAVEPQAAEVISARALADLTILLGYFERHAKNTGIGLFQKGKTWEKELEEARQQWSFNVEAIKSKTEPEAVILKVSEVARV